MVDNRSSYNSGRARGRGRGSGGVGARGSDGRGGRDYSGGQRGGGRAYQNFDNEYVPRGRRRGRGGTVPPQQYRLSVGVEPAGRKAVTLAVSFFTLLQICSFDVFVLPWRPPPSASPSSATAQPHTVSLPQSPIQRAAESSPGPLKLDLHLLEISVSATILHYDVEVELITPEGNQPLKRPKKSDMRVIRDKLCSDDPENFPINMSAYDGEKNIFSVVPLPTGQFRVDMPHGEDRRIRSYMFTIKEVNRLKLSKLKDYISGNA